MMKMYRYFDLTLNCLINSLLKTILTYQNRTAGLNRYFALSTKPLWTRKITMLDTVRLQMEKYFEDVMNYTLFDFEQEIFNSKRKDMLCLLQRIQRTCYT